MTPNEKAVLQAILDLRKGKPVAKTPETDKAARSVSRYYRDTTIDSEESPSDLNALLKVLKRPGNPDQEE